MNKLEAIEHAKYLQNIADEATHISEVFNNDVGKRFGRYKVGATVYLIKWAKRVYFTVINIRWSVDDKCFLYHLRPIHPPANVSDKYNVREDEIKQYNYSI